MPEPRKYKICKYCKNYQCETSEVEGECTVEEDIESTEFCDYFERIQEAA